MREALKRGDEETAKFRATLLVTKRRLRTTAYANITNLEQMVRGRASCAGAPYIFSCARPSHLCPPSSSLLPESS